MQRRNLADEWPPLRTITDLALRFWNVRLICRRCQHVRIFSGPAVWWMFTRRRWSDDISGAVQHFYCAPCHFRDDKRIRPKIDKTKDAPTGTPLPSPDDHEWKRLVARTRG